VKTVSRVYDSYGQAREAVRALEAAGVPSSEVSLIANKHVSAAHADVNEISDTAKGAGIGGAIGGGAGLLAGLGLLAIPGLGPVVQLAGSRRQRQWPPPARRQAASSARLSIRASRRSRPTSTLNRFAAGEPSSRRA
jgi:hypothetical protein